MAGSGEARSKISGRSKRRLLVIGHWSWIIVGLGLAISGNSAQAQAPAPTPVAPAASAPPLVLVLPFQPDESARSDMLIGYAIGMVVEAAVPQGSQVALVPGGDWINVVRTTNALRTMIPDRQLSQVAQAVGARWVILGKYSLPAEGRISCTARVLDTQTGTDQLTSAHEGALDDLFLFASQVARDAISLLKLNAQLPGEPTRLVESQVLRSLAQAAQAVDQGLVADLQGDTSSSMLLDNSAMFQVGQVLADDSAVMPLLPALESLCRAVRQGHPNHVGAIVNLGFIHYKRGDFSAALAAFTAASALAPKEREIYNFLGLTHRARRDLNAARDSYQRAIELDPDFALAYNNLGYVYDDMGDYENAIRCYQKAIELDNDPKAKLLAQGNLGVTLMNRGELDAAMAAFDAALALDPYHVDTLYNRGLALQQLGQKEEARKSYEAALNLDPTHARAHNNLGILLYEEKDSEGAAREYRRALELDTSLSSAHRNLAIVLEALEQWAEALREWEAYLRADGSIPLEDRRIARQHIDYCRRQVRAGGAGP